LQITQDTGVVEMGLGALCIERERLAHQPFGLDEIAALGLKNAVEMKRFELIGIDGERLLVERLRRIKLSGLLASHPALNKLEQFGWLAEHRYDRLECCSSFVS